MSVIFEELAGSPSGTLSDGKFTGKRMFLVDWSDWTAFMIELYGSYTLTGGTPTFNNPATFPGVPQAICTDVSFAPLSGDDPVKNGEITLSNGNAVTYDKAKISATYKIPFSNSSNSGRSDLPGVPEGTFLDFSSDHGAEYMTVPGRYWNWKGTTDRVAEDTSPGILLPTEDISLTWSRVTSPPWLAIESKKGSVNTAAFVGYPAKTLLFIGARATKSFQLTEQTFWTLDYSFRARKEEWNKYYKGDGDEWTEVEDNTNGTPPFADTSFSSLFAFE